MALASHYCTHRLFYH